MRMRRFALVTIAAVAILGILSLVLVKGRRPIPQYVFLICLDAVRPDHLSCYGYTRNTTPGIDRLADKGVLFEDAVSQAPWTTASIVTIMSSTFPCQHGARRTEGSRVPYQGLTGDFISTLGSLGYQTALFTGGIAIKDKVPARELTEAAWKWLKENRDRKCCVVIHDYETHSPYVATPDCVEALDPGYQGPFKYRFGDLDLLKKARVGRLEDVLKLTPSDLRHIEALYDCQIVRSDAAVGAFLDSLGAWGCLERSMVILFSDHGEEFLEHGSIDHGQTVYDESIRVPLIVYCPALTTKAERIDSQVGLIDLAPTIFDALGIEKPATFEGVSFAPLISARFKRSGETARPCGLPADCLVAESIARRSEKKALRCPPWKLIFDPFFGAVELYNLADDPHEGRNIIDANPEVTSRLTQTLLVMEKYYPGGWCIAWRAEGGKVRGRVTVDTSMIEAAAHSFFPDIDPETDSLVTSADWKTVRFSTAGGAAWRGLEVRMAERANATFALKTTGRDAQRPAGLQAAIGATGETSGFPFTLSPDRARVERKDLRDLFKRADVEAWNYLVFWLEPGSEPAAKAQKDKELRRQLKAIGYLE